MKDGKWAELWLLGSTHPIILEDFTFFKINGGYLQYYWKRENKVDTFPVRQVLRFINYNTLQQRDEE